MMRNDNLSSVNQQLTVISTNSRNSSPSAGEIIFFLSLVSTQLGPPGSPDHLLVITLCNMFTRALTRCSYTGTVGICAGICQPFAFKLELSSPSADSIMTI